MPLYAVITRDGFLSAEQRDVIAAEFVRIHAAAMNVPADFCSFNFSNLLAKSSVRRCKSLARRLYSGGHTRGAYVRRKDPSSFKPFWKMFRDNTGISDSDLSVALQEVPPSQAMENGGSCRMLGMRRSLLDGCRFGPSANSGRINPTRAAYRDWIRPNSQGIVIGYPGHGLSGEGHGHDPW
jgi:hypothetical protein